MGAVEIRNACEGTDVKHTGKGVITLWWGENAVEMLSDDVLHQAHGATGAVTLIPASLRRDDPAVRLIRDTARAFGLRTTVLTPRSPFSSAIGVFGGRSRWQAVHLEIGNVRIDSRMLQGHRIGLVPISSERRQGPFALDLASRFLHPIDRARLIFAPNRSRLVADVASGSQQDSWIITTIIGQDRVWLTTTDIVAAELWSLALADRFHKPALESRGPWEDPTVQRATELELGARIPTEIRLRHGVPGDMPDNIAELIVSRCRQLGMTCPAGSKAT